MNLIRLAIEKPVAILALVIMAAVLGTLALTRIPIQLAPDVDAPNVSVTTNWYGASPYEVEREIVNRQEEVLRGLEGLERMESTSENGRAEVLLEFNIDVNMDRALLLVSNRLNQIDDYPLEAGEPQLDTAGLDDNPVAWFIITRTPGNERPVSAYGDYVDDVIRDRIERVPGVSRTNLFGGTERELQVTVDPEQLATHRLTVPNVTDALRFANATVSAGDVKEGKRRYVVRAEGELQTPKQVKDVVLLTDEMTDGRIGRTRVDDIAEVGFGYKEPRAEIRFLGEHALALNAIRQTGSNIIDTMNGVREAVQELNKNELPGVGLVMQQVYDETVYIDSSIELVQQNIWVGGILAIIILLLFLRSMRATVIIGLSIPVSVIASFVAIAALGRSINVISLAGIAFAVGMVVDAAIVVLENIYRLRENGQSGRDAAYHGARQVWSAVMVSALTTVLVFIPIIVMELEAGQLFRDIAVAISVAVLMSLLVAVTVIPALSNRLLRPGNTKRFPLPVIDWAARLVARGFIGYVTLAIRSRLASFLIAMGFAGGALYLSAYLAPDLEYLPEGNRNLIFGIMLPPPGYNLDTLLDIAERVEQPVRPLWASETGEESLPGQPPKIRNYFFVALTGGTTFFGASAVQETRVRELIPVLTRSLFGEPGTFGFFTQPSLFERSFGGGRSIDIDISGPDLGAVVGIAQQAAGIIAAVFPTAEGNQMRPIPGLELGSPEIQVRPDRVRLSDNGVTARELAMSMDAFNSGIRVAEITVDSKRLDLTLQGTRNEIDHTQGIETLPVVTQTGQILPVSSVADVEVTTGPTEILHIERRRTITLQLRPNDRIPLETAINTVNNDVVGVLLAQGLPSGVKIDISGTADALTKTWEAMVGNLIVALVIVYLLMTVLLSSFLYPFVIMLSVPPATAGGILGLWVLNQYTSQSLDMLTMLGFVILIGIVVNNAILLVHQTLLHIREEGMGRRDAILEATRNRIRPIFMSTMTTVAGMMPLVLFPGAGSELYRGLGSVVVGGLTMSALITLMIVPPMLRVFIGAEEVEGDQAAFRTPVPAAGVS